MKEESMNTLCFSDCSFCHKFGEHTVEINHNGNVAMKCLNPKCSHLGKTAARVEQIRTLEAKHE